MVALVKSLERRFQGFPSLRIAEHHRRAVRQRHGLDEHVDLVGARPKLGELLARRYSGGIVESVSSARVA